jgi:hypothetical protein
MRMSVSVAERLSDGGEAFEELAKTMKRLHHSCSWPFVSRANAHLVERGVGPMQKLPPALTCTGPAVQVQAQRW